MPELTSSTREAARRIGVAETALRKAATTGRIVREADGQWDVEKTRRRLIETADPVRSPLAGMPVGAATPEAVGTGTRAGGGTSLSDGTPFARLKVAELALKVEARRLALDEEKARLLDVATANVAIDEIAGAMRDALLNWPPGSPASSPPNSARTRISSRPCCSSTSPISWAIACRLGLATALNPGFLPRTFLAAPTRHRSPSVRSLRLCIWRPAARTWMSAPSTGPVPRRWRPRIAMAMASR